jgi:methylated-DNA-[protein]-cysteine S-methyltransferase
MEAEMSWAHYDTDNGPGWIGWREDGTIEWMVLPGQPGPSAEAGTVPTQVARLAENLTRYFSGSADLPAADAFVDRASATDFETSVYRIVTAIPAGATLTYAEVAERSGRPGAARAVGAAMAKNRFAPLIPCHRVVGADGSLRGYGGGLDMKRRLLAMEATRA